MCGLVGYFNPKKEFDNHTMIYQANSLISHRGPDDEGYAMINHKKNIQKMFCGPDSPESLKLILPNITTASQCPHQLAFGFRRFSIVDLTEKGHQPFWSADRNLCLIFNGEIYNYVEIRQELEKYGHSFSTTSDTEVLLVGYQQWGMEVLKRCNGPIALVLYDKRKNRLFMARDRIGKSPLYYAIHEGTLYWASEIKCILQMTGRRSFDFNNQAIYDYLNFGWRDLNNTTFWQGIQTLNAASWTWIDMDSEPNHERLLKNLQIYWNIPEKRMLSNDISFGDATTHFRELFSDAVRIRARADANVAFSLSGGLDSSSIVAVAAKTLSKPFRTYSINFPGEAQGEEPLARLVSEQYPDMIDYHTYTPNNTDFWDVANDYIWLQEEPFHFPNAELFQAYFRKAREENYKVMITGIGGDELLAGYRAYFFPLLNTLRQKRRFAPLVSNLFLNTTLWPIYRIRKRLKIMACLLRNHPEQLSSDIPVSFFNSSGDPWAHLYLKDITIEQQSMKHQSTPPLHFEEMAVQYMSNWLMNYWQRNTNKSHFGVPMETRSPFLDYRLVDFVFTLPPEYLMNFGWTKYLLRKSVNQLLPKSVIWNRKKQGLPFNTVPWFQHAKPIVEKHIRSVYNNPYVDTDACMKHYDDLLQRQPAALWRVINFCLWWKRVILQDTL